MVIIFFRAIILLFTLLVVMRLMGKRQIGEMQPFEFIITLLIAELACVPMSDISVPLIYGIVSVLAVFILHQVFAVLEQLSQPLRHLLSGKPSVVINKNGVDILELKRNNLGVDDLIESLRGSGCFSLQACAYAIYEANGNLSVLKSSDTEMPQTLPVLLVSEGKPQKNNFRLLHLEDDFLTKLMKKEKIKNIKKIQVLTVDSNGTAYLQLNGEKYKTVKVDLPEETQW